MSRDGGGIYSRHAGLSNAQAGVIHHVWNAFFLAAIGVAGTVSVLIF